MALSRELRQTIIKKVKTDPAFKKALLEEALDAMLEGDLETGKSILRNYIHATTSFDKLEKSTGTPAKSLMRMLGPEGNPQAKNLFTILGTLQKQGKFKLAVKAV